LKSKKNTVLRTMNIKNTRNMFDKKRFKVLIMKPLL
jgi:hypothetical protein